jgi:hypothetical protein
MCCHLVSQPSRYWIWALGSIWCDMVFPMKTAAGGVVPVDPVDSGCGSQSVNSRGSMYRPMKRCLLIHRDAATHSPNSQWILLV